MSEIYILDEMPILHSPPSQQQAVYVDVPSLKKHLLSRDYGVTIYGTESIPTWVVSVHAFSGKSAFDHWMDSLPVSILPRLLALVLVKWLSTRRVTAHGWIGKAIVVAGQADSELHFLVYSENFDVSLNLHLEMRENSRDSYEKGLSFLSELRPH